MNSKNDHFEVEILNLVYGGTGLARMADGRAIFIPFVLPGEIVNVNLIENYKNYAKGQLIEIIKPSSERIQPRCQHFGECGGCHYQHLGYASQIEYKKQIFIEQLQRIGHIKDPIIRPVHPSPLEWHYRNNLQFHLDSQGELGFVNIKDNKVMPIKECFLPQAEIATIWPQLRFDRSIPIERIEIKQGDGSKVLLVLQGGSAEIPDIEIDASISVVHKTENENVVIAGDDYVDIQIHGRTFQVSAGSFFQVNNAVAEDLISLLLEKLSPRKTDTILDLYSGVGLFSAFFAPLVSSVSAVESAPEAVADFIENLDDFDNVNLYQGLVEDVLPKMDINADIVIMDPPRAGIHRKAVDALVNLSPRKIAYISCDPATLARDAKRLIAAGYELVESILLDMFPQTYHIESFNLFNLM